VLVDEYLPVFHVSDELATVVAADTATTWNALMNVDLIDVGRRRPLVGVLGALRALARARCRSAPRRAPARGTRTSDPPRHHEDSRQRRRLGTSRGTPREEIALGLIGKLWRPVIEYAHIDAEGFTQFAQHGYAKTIYALGTRPHDDGHTVLRAVSCRSLCLTPTTACRRRRS
jgi:hypothetical protein